MTLRNKAQSGYYSEYVKHSSDNLTIKEIWQKTGEMGSLSNAYYIINKNQLPHKEAQKGKGFKYLKNLKELDTENMTIKQIMGHLKLTAKSDYITILDTLNKNGLKYKKQIFKTKYENQLRTLDTENMTINQICFKLGFVENWQIKKLYVILKKLGLNYKRLK